MPIVSTNYTNFYFDNYYVARKDTKLLFDASTQTQIYFLLLYVSNCILKNSESVKLSRV